MRIETESLTSPPKSICITLWQHVWTMGLIYIKLRTEAVITRSVQSIRKNWFAKTIRNSLTKLLTTIMPKTNPDFDNKIQNVTQWIIEVDEDKGRALREIGLDDKGRTMMIMPWNDNYGFWTDSSIRFEDFSKSSDINFVDKEEFESLWNGFADKN